MKHYYLTLLLLLGSILPVCAQLDTWTSDVGKTKIPKPSTKNLPKFSIEGLQDSDTPKFSFDEQHLVLVNYAYAFAPQHSVGVTYAWMKRWGAYVNAMVGTGMHFNFKSEEIVENGKYPFLTGQTSANRLSVTGGVICRFIPWFGMYAGAGYGYRSLTAEMLNNTWINIKSPASPLHGASLEAGLLGQYKGVTLTIGFSSIISKEGKLLEGKVGIGYMFKDKLNNLSQLKDKQWL